MTRTKQETIELIRKAFEKITKYYHLDLDGTTYIGDKVEYKKYLGNFLVSHIGTDCIDVEILFIPEEFEDMDEDQVYNDVLATIGHQLINVQPTDFLTNENFQECLDAETKHDDSAYDLYNYFEDVQSSVKFFHTEGWLILNKYMQRVHPIETDIPDFDSEKQLLKRLFEYWCQSDDARAHHVNVDIISYPERACLSLNIVQDFDMWLRNELNYNKDYMRKDYTDEELQTKLMQAFGVGIKPKAEIVSTNQM